MSTLKQIEANRLNALKHGLFALDPIIEGEKPAHFEALRTSHYERFNPATPEEHVLISRHGPRCLEPRTLLQRRDRNVG